MNTCERCGLTFYGTPGQKRCKACRESALAEPAKDVPAGGERKKGWLARMFSFSTEKK